MTPSARPGATAVAEPPAAQPPAPREGALQRRFPVLRPAAPVEAGSRFPWLVTLGSTWILVGLFLDGWFHIHRGEESFFTPWHAVLYSGVGATALVHVFQHRRAGGLPPGYGLSLMAAAVIGAAGFVDMVWHTVFGIEADLEALLSPPHLLLITAGTLAFAGPLRAALLAGRDVRGGLPTAFSAAYVLTGLAFFTQYANPLTHLYPVQGWDVEAARVTSQVLPEATLELREVVGVAGVVLFAAMLGGAVAVLRQATALVPGSVLVVVLVPAVFLSTLRGTMFLLPGVLLAALVTELAARRLPAAPLAALAGGLLITSWVLTLAVAHELAWSLELLTGSIGSAAAAAYLAGWLVQSGARTQARTG